MVFYISWRKEAPFIIGIDSTQEDLRAVSRWPLASGGWQLTASKVSGTSQLASVIFV